MENSNITAEKILQELGLIAFARFGDYMCVDQGQLTVKDSDTLSPQQAAAVASVEKTAGGLKVKFYDKLKALELLGKAVGLFDGLAAHQEDNGLLEAILEATKD